MAIKTQNFGSDSFSRMSYVESLRPDPLFAEIEAKAAELVAKTKQKLKDEPPIGPDFDAWNNPIDESDQEVSSKLESLGINPDFLHRDFEFSEISIVEEIKELQKDMPEDEMDDFFVCPPPPTGENFAQFEKLVKQEFVSALDIVKKGISTAIEQSIFEPNDSITRDQVSRMIENYLDDLNKKGLVADYSVICDETNNPPSAVDSGEIFVDTVVKLKDSKEFVHIPANGWSSKYGATIEVSDKDGMVNATTIDLWNRSGAGSKVETLADPDPVECWFTPEGLNWHSRRERTDGSV